MGRCILWSLVPSLFPGKGGAPWSLFSAPFLGWGVPQSGHRTKGSPLVRTRTGVPLLPSRTRHREDPTRVVCLLHFHAGRLFCCYLSYQFLLFLFLVAISSAFVCLAGLFLLCVPGYGRHSEVYGDRIAISNRQPPLPVSTPTMDVRKSIPPPPPISPNYYPSVQRPLSVQGYATRGYTAGQHSDSSGYPGLVRAGGYNSMPYGYGGF